MTNSLNPTFQDVTPRWVQPPNMKNWYVTSTVSGVSEEALPWMLAQGWKVNSVNVDDTVRPPLRTYLMARTKLLHWNVLGSLMVEFTNSFNEGRSANDKRYEDVVFWWRDVLDKHQDCVADFQANKAQDATTGYVTLMLNKVDELKTEYDTMKTDYDSYDSGDRATELAKLKTTWSAAADTAQSEYDTMTSGLDLPAIISEVDSAIDEFARAVTDFNDAYRGLSKTLVSDYDAHAILARGFLTDLGTTDLARINETFDNTLATQLQTLTDRGFYSSAMTTDVQTRVTRERNEAIAELNDKLNREKLANQHQLYDQKYRMRLGGLEAGMKVIDASAKVVQTYMQQGQWSAEIRHQIASLSVDSRLKVLGLRQRYYELLLQSISWESDRRTQIYDRLVQVRMQQFELLGRTCDKDFQLLKYQLDERNNIAASLFGFVERRTDAYPDQNSMAQLAANLGETGASTWHSA